MSRLRKIWQRLRERADVKSGAERPGTTVAVKQDDLFTVNPDGTVMKYDRDILEMGDWKPAIDARQIRVGDLLLSSQSTFAQQQQALAQQALAQQAFAPARSRGSGFMAAQGLSGLLSGDVLGSGNIVFSQSPTISEPKAQRDIPIQEPVGKRRIKLRD